MYLWVGCPPGHFSFRKPLKLYSTEICSLLFFFFTAARSLSASASVSASSLSRPLRVGVFTPSDVRFSSIQGIRDDGDVPSNYTLSNYATRTLRLDNLITIQLRGAGQSFAVKGHRKAELVNE